MRPGLSKLIGFRNKRIFREGTDKGELPEIFDLKGNAPVWQPKASTFDFDAEEMALRDMPVRA